jgi:4-hydroxybenzoate polyprenyltransferase
MKNMQNKVIIAPGAPGELRYEDRVISVLAVLRQEGAGQVEQSSAQVSADGTTGTAAANIFPTQRRFPMREHVLALPRNGFLRGYVITMRPYLMFISGITGIAGMSFAPGRSAASTLLISLASFLSYGFGQALTDCFQTDTDALSAPYRPLTRGLISKKHVLAVSLLGLAWCVVVMTVLSPLNIILGTLAGAGLWTYTYFKRRWWGGPWYNAWIVAVLCAMAFLAGGGDAAALFSRYGCLLLAVFFGYANFVLIGYFKDIEADRSTGYNTLPVLFGRKVSAYASDILAVLTIAALAVLFAREGLPGEPSAIAAAAILGLAGLVQAVVAQYRIHRVSTEKEAHRAIDPHLQSYILLLSCAACLHRPGYFFPLVIFYALYMLAVNLRPSRYQI